MRKGADQIDSGRPQRQRDKKRIGKSEHVRLSFEPCARFKLRGSGSQSASALFWWGASDYLRHLKPPRRGSILFPHHLAEIESPRLAENRTLEIISPSLRRRNSGRCAAS